MSLRLTINSIKELLIKAKNYFIEYLKSHFQKAAGTIIIDLDSKPLPELNKNINIVLSPAFYWIKKEKLPIKSVFQARKVAPTLFDGVIPDGEYSYKAIKDEDGSFLFFAYDEKLIAEKLKELQIKDYLIKNIYFAQTEIKDLNKPLLITPNYALIQKDGIIARIDAKFVSNPISEIDLSKHTKNSVKISRYNSYIFDTKTIEKTYIAIILLIVAYTVSYHLKSLELNKLNQKKDAIFAKYKLPPMSIQRDAIKKGLEKTLKDQIAFRENLSYLFSIPLLENEYIVSIKASKEFSIAIKLAEEKRAEVIKEYLEKRFSLKSAKVKDGIISIEGSL